MGYFRKEPVIGLSMDILLHDTRPELSILGTEGVRRFTLAYLWLMVGVSLLAIALLLWQIL